MEQVKHERLALSSYINHLGLWLYEVMVARRQGEVMTLFSSAQQ